MALQGQKKVFELNFFQTPRSTCFVSGLFFCLVHIKVSYGDCSSGRCVCERRFVMSSGCVTETVVRSVTAGWKRSVCDVDTGLVDLGGLGHPWVRWTGPVPGTSPVRWTGPVPGTGPVWWTGPVGSVAEWIWICDAIPPSITFGLLETRNMRRPLWMRNILSIDEFIKLEEKFCCLSSRAWS